METSQSFTTYMNQSTVLWLYTVPEFTFYKRQGKVVQAIVEAIYVVKRPQIEFTTSYVSNT